RSTSSFNTTFANPILFAADMTFVTAGSEKSLIFNGPVTLNGNRTATSGIGATVAGTGLSFSNVIDDGASTFGLTKAGAGNLFLTGLNTFNGPLVLAGGVVQVNTLANIGSASALGAGDNTSAASNAASLVFNGGTLSYTGGATTVTRGFTLGAGG